MRSWLIALVMLVVSLMLAVGPLAALVGALWAVGAAALALWRLAQLALAGAALTSSATPVYLRMLDVAGRGGFVALAYLALMFALMTLMAGLFGRRWGRLFALPGAVFTATAMVTLGLATFYAAPLLGALAIPPAWLLAAAAYLLVDVILVSGALVDASLTRSPTATGQHRAIPRTSVRKTSPPDALPT